jgi:hypothetical protein
VTSRGDLQPNAPLDSNLQRSKPWLSHGDAFHRRRTHWFDESRIDLNGHCPVKQGNREYKPVTSLEIYQYSFMSSQRTSVDPNPVAGTEERPWLVRKA